MREMLRIVALISLIFLPFSLVFASSGGGGEVPRAKSLFSGNPLGGAFYENRGQIADADGESTPDIKYYAFYNGVRVYFTPQGWHTVYTVAGQHDDGVSEATGMSMNNPLPDPAAMPGDRLPDQETRLYRLDMTFIGCNTDVEIEATGRQPRYLNYYLGHCPDGITKVPGFGGLRYKNLYDNIDLVLHASKEGLKYEFEVRPGGRVEDIRMRHDGQDGIESIADGSLRLHWPKGYTQEGQPFSYQEDADGLLMVPSQYITEGNDVRFAVEKYNAARTLVIDPWSTYYGGKGYDPPAGIATDTANAVLVTGGTYSTDFPLKNAWQSGFPGSLSYMLFVIKLDDAGGLLWATFFGGDFRTHGWDVASDLECNVIVVGHTCSWNFPVHNAFQPLRRSAASDVASGVIAKLDAMGIRVWATYFGGQTDAAVGGVDTDGDGNLFVAGGTRTSSSWQIGFPLYRAHQPQAGGEYEAFYAKMDSAGRLIFSSFLGGSGEDNAYGIAVDTNGNFAIGGSTESLDFPVRRARQPVFGGGTEDGFIALFDSSGVPRWSSYLGGSLGAINKERVRGVAMDMQGNVLATGVTTSPNFPVRYAIQDTLASTNGLMNAFITKCDSSGALLWSTFYGGTTEDEAAAISTDDSSNVYVAGSTNSVNFPLLNPTYPVKPGSQDAFILKIDSSGRRRWASWFGGSAFEELTAITSNGSGNVTATGMTESTNYPMINAWQPTKAGHSDMFITRVLPDGYIPVTLSRIAAQRVSGGVELAWRTESEVNAYGFIIEREFESKAGAAKPAWRDIGFVPSTTQGNEDRDYNYLDLDPGTTDTRIFYRLRMVDLDGTFEHSPVVEVAPESEALAVSFETAYPSPARDWLTLNFTLPEESVVNLAVYDVSGREIVRVYDQHSILAGARSVVLPVGEWRAGLYLCRLEACGTRMVKRAMVVR